MKKYTSTNASMAKPATATATSKKRARPVKQATDTNAEAETRSTKKPKSRQTSAKKKSIKSEEPVNTSIASDEECTQDTVDHRRNAIRVTDGTDMKAKKETASDDDDVIEVNTNDNPRVETGDGDGAGLDDGTEEINTSTWIAGLTPAELKARFGSIDVGTDDDDDEGEKVEKAGAFDDHDNAESGGALGEVWA